MKILWFSLCPPYKEVKHAGGQALYKHVLSFLEHKEVEVKMVSLCKKEEQKYVRPMGCNFSIELIPDEAGKLSILDYESRWNPWHKFGGYLSNSRWHKLKKKIIELKKEGYSPDLIIFNWTEMLALSNLLRKLYPNAKHVAIEEDVAFVKRKRRWELSSNAIAKLFHCIRFKTCIKKERNWLNTMNLIAVYSNKDKKRLESIGIDGNNVFVFSPVFADKSNLIWNRKNNDILFWGAMSRKENSDSALWFIRNVMPLLDNLKCRFAIVGANPPEELMKEASDRVIVTGFVDSPNQYFEDSMCMVVPLVIGAGIKIKVLEGLSSGIPVISNEIGIEGIAAQTGNQYLHAETAVEFAEAIKKVNSDKRLSEQLSQNAKKMIATNYNEQRSTEQFIALCKELV